MSKLSIRLSEETVKALGRAITDKADLIYQAYSPDGCYEVVNETHKQYQLLQDSGVISINPNNITLGSSFTAILKNLDRKSRNANIAPDIELSKHQISSEVALAQIKLDSLEDESEEMMHLANIRDTCICISEYLGREMANIEYIINSDLNNTPSIKEKRQVLESLNKKIKLQLEKIEILSRDELRKLHGEYTPAAVILNEYLADSISKFNIEMGVHLQKILILIDKLKKEQDRKSKRLWLLRKALRNNQLTPEKISIEYNDIVDKGLAFGGMALADTLHNIETVGDSEFLYSVVSKISAKKPKRKSDNLYKGEYEEFDREHKKPPPSPEKLLVMQYMADNCDMPSTKALSVREYWSLSGLERKIHYKAFLALFLKVAKSDFINDRIIKSKGQFSYKVYLKSQRLSDTCDTRYVVDAKYIKFNRTEESPSREQIWKQV